MKLLKRLRSENNGMTDPQEDEPDVLLSEDLSEDQTHILSVLIRNFQADCSSYLQL